MSDNNPARDSWNAALELLLLEGALSSPQQAFARMATPLGYTDGIFVISVGSEFVKNLLEEQVSSSMTSMLSNILGREIQLTITIDPTLNESQPRETPSSEENASYVPPVVTKASLPPVPSSPTPAVETVYSENSSARNTDIPLSHEPPVETIFGRETTKYVDHTAVLRTEDFTIPPEVAQRAKEAGLNPRYTFDTFVIGENNRFATATSLAVAESPGINYNPLFLYSDSGMGKTHLMHAIGNYALSLYPHIKVRYASAEDFTNAFINAIAEGKQAQFKDQFRSVDILLIDDIQFIGMGQKEQTLEEFFHTFNALTNANKQIVITSDVSPKMLKGFEERLISRFISGITANIDKPSLETRIAILEKKAQTDGYSVPRDVAEYIATNMTTNVREMEGALTRVIASADVLYQRPLDVSIAEIILKDLIDNPDSVEITSSLIMGQTASYYGITIEEMISSDRSRLVATARQAAMYLCREMTELSLPKIGSIFGKRDHTTVMHACRKINKLMAENQTTLNNISELTSRIKQAAQHAAQHPSL